MSVFHTSSERANKARATSPPLVFTINGGSSTIKFAVFPAALSTKKLLSGQVDRVGSGKTTVTFRSPTSPGRPSERDVGSTMDESVAAIVSVLRENVDLSAVVGIGHRIVHGGVHLLEHQRITADVMTELRRTQPVDLAHLPHEIALIELFGNALPNVPQFACFDTAFHRDMPSVAQRLPIPRTYSDAGIRRLGFHGLSYTYLLEKLRELAGEKTANGRIVFAHLGSGASMTAVRGGKPMDTTMAFTPTSGLVMGTRAGDLDPGLLLYLMKERGASVEDMETFISSDCGLRGVSATTSDMRDLLRARETDIRAAEAVELFCYQAKKHLCALVATLNGLDTLVFSGGIGQQSEEIRSTVCSGLTFLGIELLPPFAPAGPAIISTPGSKVAVWVIPTDEEVVIQRAVLTLLATR